MPKKKPAGQTNSTKKKNWSSKYFAGFFIALFLFSMFGFSLELKRFMHTHTNFALTMLNFDLKKGEPAVAGSKSELPKISIEVRSADIEKALEFANKLKNYPEFNIVNVNQTLTTYQTPIIVSTVKDQRLVTISKLENIVMVSTQPTLPDGEVGFTTDALVIVP